MNKHGKILSVFVGLSLFFHAGLLLSGILKSDGQAAQKEELQRVIMLPEEQQPVQQTAEEPRNGTPDTTAVKPKVRKPRHKPRPRIAMPKPVPKKIEKPKVVARTEETAVQPAAIEPNPPAENVSHETAPEPIRTADNDLTQCKGIAAASGVGDIPRGMVDWKKDYKKKVYSRIQRAKRYPYAARRDGQEGRVVVRFTVSRSGGLQSVSVVKPSPYPILNSDALEWVRRACPFPPFPSYAEENSMVFTYSLRYDLRD